MINFVQGNLQRSRAADSLLEQLVIETKAQCVIASEPYRNRTTTSWFHDRLGVAAIWIADGREIRVLDNGSGDGFVWVRLDNVTVYSLYLSPNYPAREYREKLEAM